MLRLQINCRPYGFLSDLAAKLGYFLRNIQAEKKRSVFYMPTVVVDTVVKKKGLGNLSAGSLPWYDQNVNRFIVY